MPPSRRPAAIRDTSDMVDDNALHITQEQSAVFGERRIVLKESEAQALQEKAAQADWLRQQLAQQSNGLAIQEDGLVVEGFRFSPTGLVSPDRVSPQEWRRVGDLLFRLEGSIQWLIGDWLVYGERLEYGDIKKIAEDMGRDEHTLYNYKTVSRAIESSRRRELISFSHHYEVMGLPVDKQEYALSYLERDRMNLKDFRKWIKLGMPEGGLKSIIPSSTQSTSTDPEREQFYGTYMPEANRYLFGIDRVEDLPDEHRKDAAVRAEWLADYYSNISKQLKGRK